MYIQLYRYLIQIILMIYINWPEILIFSVPVHVVFILYMLICIEIIKLADGYKNEYMIN